MSDSTARLIDNSDVTVALLADPLAWRVRVVEELTIDSATSCLRRRSLQVAPLRSVLRDHVADTDTHALLALNIAPMPRGPLLDFDVQGPLGDGWLLPRTEIAGRQAKYLLQLAADSQIPASAEVEAVLTLILSFTGEWFVDRNRLDFRAYLRDGLGFDPSPTQFAEWVNLGARCKQVLRPYLDVFKGYSAPENPMLVLPAMIATEIAASVAEASKALLAYTELLERLSELARDSDGPDVASEFLTALADYGNTYDLVVAMKVPLDEPFLIKFTERRDLQFSLTGRDSQQELVVADARTNHVTFKVTDPNVRVTDFLALQPATDEYSYGAFQSRTDHQSRAFYAHDPDRDYRIRLSFRLALLRRLQVVPYVIAALLTALVVGLWTERPTQLPELALIVGPSALAASVLLYREPTTLGSRLRMTSSAAVTAALLALLGTATWLYVSGLNVGSVN